MSELINNSDKRVSDLKELLKKLHQGTSVEETRKHVIEMLGKIPYGEVVQAEQELIKEGMQPQEIQKYCDLHSLALRDNIDLTFEKSVPAGHPIHTFKTENREIEKELNSVKEIFIKINFGKNNIQLSETIVNLKQHFNNLTDIEKHYSRKENLLFPFLEKHGITGPSTVMWGKDDEVREFMKSALKILNEDIPGLVELEGLIELVLKPTINAIQEMIEKEEKILLPMSLDKLTEMEWFQIYKQSDEIGYCLLAPEKEWIPNAETSESYLPKDSENKIVLSTGSFSLEELEAVFNSMQVDLTFVDKDDTVKFFSHGNKRIFQRNKAILGRKVHYCHPPHSVHIVEKILDDFKSGRQDSAKFWINFQGMFVHIAYYPVRSKDGEYLGTLEVTQDIAEFKNTEGERRLLTYE
jgi:hypothetical protein